MASHSESARSSISACTWSGMTTHAEGVAARETMNLASNDGRKIEIAKERLSS